MRGQWISTTRRLNKHYQDGNREKDPFSWGPFWCSWAEQPAYWEHTSASGPNVNPDTYYNISDSAIYSIAIPNYAQISYAMGYRSNKDYDGLFYPGYGAGTNANPTVDVEILDDYDDFVFGPKGAARCVFQDAYIRHDIDTCFKLWDDEECVGLGSSRYMRIHTPKYGFATPYYWCNEEYPYIPASALNPRWRQRLAHSQFNPQSRTPVYNGIELTSLATKQHANMVGANWAKQQIRMVYRDSVYTILNGESNADSGINFSHYDNLESQHKLYLDTGFTFTANARPIEREDEDEEFVSMTVGCRIYVFFYKGDLYMDLVPEIYDPNTMELLELDREPHIRDMRYPSVVFGYPTIPSRYIHPEEGYAYPSWLRTFIKDPTVYDNFFNAMVGQTHFTGMDYGTDYAGVYNGCLFMRMYPLKEEEFEEAKAAKQAEWGI